MKRFVLIALVLALFAAVPACAADLPVFAIEKDGVVIGTAVMVGSENTFLTTAPISREDQLFLAAGDEKLPLEAFVDTDGLLSLVFTETPVPGTPLTLGPLTAEDISATGFLPDGTLVQGDCRHISYVTYPNGKIRITPPGSEIYADRNAAFPHKIDKNDLAYKEFTAHGFTWGGDWKTLKDYQHFQKAK